MYYYIENKEIVFILLIFNPGTCFWCAVYIWGEPPRSTYLPAFFWNKCLPPPILELFRWNVLPPPNFLWNGTTLPPKSTNLISTPPKNITFELHSPQKWSIASTLPPFFGKIIWPPPILWAPPLGVFLAPSLMTLYVCPDILNIPVIPDIPQITMFYVSSNIPEIFNIPDIPDIPEIP